MMSINLLFFYFIVISTASTLTHDTRDYDDRCKSNHVISRLCIDALIYLSGIKNNMLN